MPPGIAGLNFTGVLQAGDCPLVELPGVNNSKQVREAPDNLKPLVITVPV